MDSLFYVDIEKSQFFTCQKYSLLKPFAVMSKWNFLLKIYELCVIYFMKIAMCVREWSLSVVSLTLYTFFRRNKYIWTDTSKEKVIWACHKLTYQILINSFMYWNVIMLYDVSYKDENSKKQLWVVLWIV